MSQEIQNPPAVMSSSSKDVLDRSIANMEGSWRFLTFRQRMVHFIMQRDRVGTLLMAAALACVATGGTLLGWGTGHGVDFVWGGVAWLVFNAFGLAFNDAMRHHVARRTS